MDIKEKLLFIFYLTRIISVYFSRVNNPFKQFLKGQVYKITIKNKINVSIYSDTMICLTNSLLYKLLLLSTFGLC